jgi:glycosyltransferase involved in cell wall biosynthesis
MQNKILEAMALSVPSITTTLANNAIMAQHKETIWVADTKEELVLGIETLLSDKALYEKIKGNAKEFVRERYNWNTIIEVLSKSIQI